MPNRATAPGTGATPGTAEPLMPWLEPADLSVAARVCLAWHECAKEEHTRALRRWLAADPERIALLPRLTPRISAHLAAAVVDFPQRRRLALGACGTGRPDVVAIVLGVTGFRHHTLLTRAIDSSNSLDTAAVVFDHVGRDPVSEGAIHQCLGRVILAGDLDRADWIIARFGLSGDALANMRQPSYTAAAAWMQRRHGIAPLAHDYDYFGRR